MWMNVSECLEAVRRFMSILLSIRKRGTVSGLGFGPAAGRVHDLVGHGSESLAESKFMSPLLFAVRRLAIYGWLLAMPLLVSGQNAFSPGGNDYVIAGALAGDQTAPQAAVNTTGGWLVWQDNAANPNGLRIRAQRLNGSLAQAQAPFLVSSAAASASAGDQEKPQVALLNNGGAVFVWQGGKFGFQKIYARFCAANGSFLTSDILVNTYANNFQINPGVATLADGSVVVVWASDGQDGDLQGIFGQRFSAAGVKLGGEFQINQWTAKNQRTPAVAALANSNFVVAWVSELQRNAASVDIYARKFNSSGTAVGNEFPVNVSPTNLCANPALAGSPQGGFAVAWSQKDDQVLTAGSQSGVLVTPAQTSKSPNSWDVFARRFNATGVAIGEAVRLNTQVYGDQYAPKLSAFGKNYLAVWNSLGQDTSREGLFGQFLSSDGSLEGVEFRVNTTTISRQIHPTIASDGLNRFLVVWSSFVANSSFDLFARSYDLIRLEMAVTPRGVTLSWNTQPGLAYQVQTSANGSTWASVGGLRTAAGYSDSVTVSSTGGSAFYRVIRPQ